jgi:hypothetical protein
VKAIRDRTLADRGPYAPRAGFQADAMLVCGKDLDRFAGGALRLLRQQRPRAFLNAAAFSGEADLGSSDGAPRL